METKETVLHEVIPAEQATSTWLVESASGNGQYTVSTDGTNWSCTCPGYLYRGDCRHIKENRGS
jgi:hypothetical protein